jgi:hypothetical protein
MHEYHVTGHGLMVGNTTVNYTLVYGAMSMQHSEIDTGLLLVGMLNMTITGRDVYGNLVTGEERAFAVNEIEVRPTAAAEPSDAVSENDN